MVCQISHVGFVGIETYRWGYGDIGKVSFGRVVVIVDVEVELIAEESAFYPDVSVVSELSFQIGISQSRYQCAEISAINRCQKCIEARGLTFGEVLVPGCAHIESQGQFLQYIVAFQERFVVHVPSESYRPVGCCLLVFSVNRRTVDTTGQVDQITVVIGIVDIGKSTRCPYHTFTTRRPSVQLILYSVGKIIERVAEESRKRIAVAVVFVLTDFAAPDGLYVVDSERMGIRDYDVAFITERGIVTECVFPPIVKYAGSR